MQTLRQWLQYLRLRSQHVNAQRALIRELVEPPLLDVGCGDGWLLEGPGKRVGLDNTQRGDLPPNAIHRDVSGEWDLEERFRTVSMIQLIEHLRPEQVRHCFREAHGVLEHGGRLIVETPTGDNVWESLDHVRPYPPQALTRWLQGSYYPPVPGFDLVRQWTWSATRWTPLRPLMHLLAQWDIGRCGSWLMVFEKH